MQERDHRVERGLRSWFFCFFNVHVSVQLYICAQGNLPLTQRSTIHIFFKNKHTLIPRNAAESLWIYWKATFK